MLVNNQSDLGISDISYLLNSENLGRNLSIVARN